MIDKKLLSQFNKNIKKQVHGDKIFKFEEIKSYWDEFFYINENKEELYNYDEDIIKISQLNSLRFGVLSLSIGKLEENQHLNVLCQGLFSTIANTALAITKLACDGLDYQANNLIRNIYELCFTLLNIIIDKEKRIALFNPEDKDEYQIWRNHFTFKKLDRTIKQYEKTICNFEEGSFLETWREDRYKSYSGYVHNNFLDFFLFSYASPKNDSDCLNINLWGKSVTRANDILLCLNDVLWYTSLLFYKLLCDEKIDVEVNMLCDIESMKTWNFASYLHFLINEYYFYIKSKLSK